MGQSRGMKTAFTALLNLKIPLIQAPMAGVSTPGMAAAVSNAGALGSVPLGALSAEGARTALAATRALTDRPFAANVFVHPTPGRDADRESVFLRALTPLFEGTGVSPPEKLEEIYRSFNDDDGMLDVLFAAQPAVVSLHFGAASGDRMRALRSAGIRVLGTATSVEEAELLADNGVDGLVMQGYGAGGHSGAFLAPPDPATGGRQGLLKLIRDTVAAVTLPVIAAGGLMDGADVREMLDAGASGAQLGTAFIGCPESLASDAYRRALPGGSTELSSRISGRPARGLNNELMRWASAVAAEPPDYPLTYDGVKQLIAARNDSGFSVMWAGEGAARTRALPAAELVRRIQSEL